MLLFRSPSYYMNLADEGVDVCVVCGHESYGEFAARRRKRTSVANEGIPRLRHLILASMSALQ
jgi:hypothetical protein